MALGEEPSEPNKNSGAQHIYFGYERIVERHKQTGAERTCYYPNITIEEHGDNGSVQKLTFTADKCLLHKAEVIAAVGDIKDMFFDVLSAGESHELPTPSHDPSPELT